MTVWVVDTSPLIFMSRLGRLNLLQSGADQVVIPQAVFDEIQVRPDEAARQIEQATLSWLTVKQVDDLDAVDLLRADLDRGEAEVIVLAKKLGADWVIIDDLDARRFARRVGLNLVGTVGLLLAARLRGEITSLRGEIERLEQLGFRVAPSLANAMLEAAQE
ncbi:MAG: DUF3368 domain-containing protein [Anaerolineae bacterium]|nr:DUF3368 domain-containing protein [Anaerolineae bacterium]